MERVDQADRFVIFAVVVTGLAKIVGTVEHEVARRRLELCLVEQSLQRHAGPFADAAPAARAVMPGDLRAPRHGAQLRQRKFERLCHQTINLEFPIGKSIGGKRPVVVIVYVGRAVRLEVLRDVGLAIFAGKRSWRQKRSLGDARQRFGRIEDASQPGLIGQLAVTTSKQGSAGDGESTRKETAPVELGPSAHGWPSGSLIT